MKYPITLALLLTTTALTSPTPNDLDTRDDQMGKKSDLKVTLHTDQHCKVKALKTYDPMKYGNNYTDATFGFYTLSRDLGSGEQMNFFSTQAQFDAGAAEQEDGSLNALVKKQNPCDVWIKDAGVIVGAKKGCHSTKGKMAMCFNLFH